MSDATLITVLYVDDNALLQFVFKEIIATMGHGVLTAADGEPALKLWRESSSPVHLVVTDLHMPTMSGVHLLQQLRQEGYKGPVWLCTGDNLPSAEARRLGADGVLRKPFVLSDLQQLVATVAR